MTHMWRPYFLAVVFTVLSLATAQRYQEAFAVREELNKDPERSDEIALDSDEKSHSEDILLSVNFQCKSRSPGYYADPQFGCEVFHYCHKDGTRVTIVCSEDRSKLHKICHFRNAAIKACGETPIYFVLTDTLPQKKGKGTTASGINDATDFKLPLVIPRPTMASYVVSHPTKPLRIGSRSGDEKMPLKVFPSSSIRKASEPFRVGSGPQQAVKVNVFKPYTPIRFDLKDGEKVFEVFAGSGKSEQLHSEIQRSGDPQRYFGFRNNENFEADESNNDSIQRNVPLKQKRIQILKTVFPSGIDKSSKIHLHFSSKTPKTYFESPSYYDNKTDYKQYYIAKPGISKSNGSIYLIEVYHKDFDKDNVGDYSSYKRKAKNVSFLLSSEKSDLKESLAKSKAKKNPRRKKRETAEESSPRRPLAVIYAKVPGKPLPEVSNAPSVGSDRNQIQENIQVSISPNVVPLELTAIPIAIRSPTPQISNSFPRSNSRTSNSRQPKTAVIYDNAEEQSLGQQFSEQRNVYYVSPDRLPQTPRSQKPQSGNNILRSIVNPSYRITEDQQADPSQTPSKLHTENKVPSTQPKLQNNLPRVNNFSPGAQSAHEVVPQIENGPKILNQRPQGIPYFQDPVEPHYFLDPQGIIPRGQFSHFNLFGEPSFASTRPSQDERLILNVQQQHPTPRQQRLPNTHSQDSNDETVVKESSEEEKGTTVNTQNANHRPQSPTSESSRPTYGLPPGALRQAVLPGFSPFVPHDYSGPNLQQHTPLGVPPFGFIAPHNERPSYPFQNIPQQFSNDRRPQASFRGTPAGTQNLGRPTDTSSSEEHSDEHSDRFKSERNQRGRYIPQQGAPQQFARPILNSKPDSSEEGTRTHDSRNNNQRPNYQQFTPQDVRPANLNVPDLSSGVPQNNLQRPVHSQNHPNIILPQGLLLHPHSRPFEISEINPEGPNEHFHFQGRPPPNHLSHSPRPLRPTHTSEEEIVRTLGDFSRRPPPITTQTHQSTRARGPSSVKYVDSDDDDESYSRRPSRPITSEVQSSRLHRPSESQNPRLHRPSEAQNHRLHRPSNAQSPRPYRPTEAQGPRPHRPSEGQNPRPHRPSEAQGPRPHKPSEAQSPRPQRPSEAQSPRPQRPSEAQIPRPQRPSEAQSPRLQRPSEAQIPRPYRPSEVQSTRPNNLSEGQISRPNYLSEAQISRPNHLSEAQISRPNHLSEAQFSKSNRPSEVENSRHLRPVQVHSTRTLRPSGIQNQRNHHQPFIQANGNVRPQQGYDGIPHHLNKYSPEDERVLIHRPPYTSDRDNTGVPDKKFQRGVTESTADDYTPSRYISNEERLHQKPKKPNDYNKDESYVNINYPVTKPFVSSPENQVHYGHRNPPDERNRNSQSRPYIRDSHSESSSSDHRNPPPQTSYDRHIYPEEKTRINPPQTHTDGSRKSRPTVPDREHFRQKQNENHGNSVNVVSSVGDYGSRQYHSPTSSEIQDDKSFYTGKNRHQHTTQRPEAVRNSETLTGDSVDSERGTHFHRTSENEPNKSSRGSKTSHSENSDESVTRPKVTTTTPRPPRKKPTPPRPTFPAFPTFPPPIRRPIPTIPTKLEEEISPPAEETDEVDPYAHMRVRQNSRPRIAPTVSTISYSTNIGPYLPEEKNELQKTTKTPATGSRQRPRKRAKGRVRRPKPTVQTTTETNEAHEKPPTTVAFSDGKKNLDEDEKYGGRTEHTTVKPEPLSTSYSSETEVTTQSDGYGNRINLFTRPLNRRPSTYRLSVTTQPSAKESDGSAKKITAVPITRRRRPYKKKIRTKTTTTESPSLTESESIARSDEEIESLLYVERDTTVLPTESPLQREVYPVLERNTEPAVLPTATTVSIIVNENDSQSNTNDQRKGPLDGNQRSVLDKFKNRPRLLRFGRPRPRSGTEERSADNSVAESKTSETKESSGNENKR